MILMDVIVAQHALKIRRMDFCCLKNMDQSTCDSVYFAYAFAFNPFDTEILGGRDWLDGLMV